MLEWVCLKVVTTPINGVELCSPLPHYWDSFYGHWYELSRLGLLVASILVFVPSFGAEFFAAKHPKYLLNWRRLYITRLHVACGPIEIILLVAALALRTPVFAFGACMVCAVHCTTSLYMMTGLFGTKRIVYPAFLWVTIIHAVNGVRLLLQLGTASIVLDVALTLLIYVWVRVIYIFIEKFRILEEHQYTISVVLSGMIMLPWAHAGGALTDIFGLLFVVGFAVLSNSCSSCAACADVPLALDVERSRHDFFIAGLRRSTTRQEEQVDEVVDAIHASGRFGGSCPIASLRSEMRGCSSVSSGFGIGASDACEDMEDQVVRACFDKLCIQSGEGMSLVVLQELFVVWGLPLREATPVFDQIKDKSRRDNLSRSDDTIDFNEFKAYMSPVYNYALPLKRFWSSEPSLKRSDKLRPFLE